MEVEELMKCLADCGCDPVQTEVFLKLKENCCKDSCIRYLKRYRKQLMEEIHKIDHQVDCVDYVIRELEKQKEEGK